MNICFCFSGEVVVDNVGNSLEVDSSCDNILWLVVVVVGCGWLWLVVVGCGWLWLVVVGCGW